MAHFTKLVCKNINLNNICDNYVHLFYDVMRDDLKRKVFYECVLRLYMDLLYTVHAAQ